MGTPDFSSFGGTVSTLVDPLDLVSGRGTKKSLDAQKKAADQANQTQRYIFDQTRADNEPWREAGVTALGLLSDPAKLQANFTQDPAYQFRLNEGLKAVQGSAAARGMGNSGVALKELTRYGQDFASNEYGNYYNRLSNLAGVGQMANAQNQQAGANYGNNVSANQIGLGNAQAAAITAQGNRINNLVGQGMTAAAMFSDSRLKTNIKEISETDLNEMKSHLKAYAFNYLNDDHGQGDWIGVMAQDLEKSKLGKTLVVENEKGEKTIDQRKVLSMFLATMAVA